MARPRTAAFFADASVAIGGGHVWRCVSLAAGLADRGWQIVFAGSASTSAVLADACRASNRSPFGFVQLDGSDPAQHISTMLAAIGAPADLAIVDHYAREKKYHAALRSMSACVLVIDDLANRNYDCDALVDQNAGRSAADYAGRVPCHTKIMTGPDFALLNGDFGRSRPASLQRRATSGEVRRVLVFMGTTDPDDVTSTVVRGLDAVRAELAIDVVLGRLAPARESVGSLLAESRHPATLHVATPRMAALMTGADLAIGAGGVASLERCCLGLPSAIIITAENQRTGAEFLAGREAAVLLGGVNEVRADHVASAIATLHNQPEKRAAMAQAAAAVCDGLGVSRVMDAVEALSGSAARSI